MTHSALRLRIHDPEVRAAVEEMIDDEAIDPGGDDQDHEDLDGWGDWEDPWDDDPEPEPVFQQYQQNVEDRDFDPDLDDDLDEPLYEELKFPWNVAHRAEWANEFPFAIWLMDPMKADPEGKYRRATKEKMPPSYEF